MIGVALVLALILARNCAVRPDKYPVPAPPLPARSDTLFTRIRCSIFVRCSKSSESNFYVQRGR